VLLENIQEKQHN
jgi:hypothetical protein